MVEYSSMFLAAFGLAMCIIDHELTLSKSDSSYWRYSLLIYNLFCTGGLMYSIYTRYMLHLSVQILHGNAYDFETIKSMGWRSQLYKEFFIVALSPIPGFNLITYNEKNVDYNLVIQYDLNDIMLALMFVRIYLFGRWLLHQTTYMHPRSQRVCMMNGCQAEMMYAVKALMREYPYRCIVGTIVVSIMIYAY